MVLCTYRKAGEVLYMEFVEIELKVYYSETYSQSFKNFTFCLSKSFTNEDTHFTQGLMILAVFTLL